MGISEGIPPEDVATTGSRDGQTPADADRFGKCFVAHFELELEDPRGKKSSSGGRRQVVRAQDYARLVGGRGRSFRGRYRAWVAARWSSAARATRVRSRPPRRRPSLASSTTTTTTRWAAVKEMAEPPEDPDAPGPEATTRRGVARDTRRPGRSRAVGVRAARALLGKPPSDGVREISPLGAVGRYTANGRRESRGVRRAVPRRRDGQARPRHRRAREAPRGR